MEKWKWKGLDENEMLQASDELIDHFRDKEMRPMDAVPVMCLTIINALLNIAGTHPANLKKGLSAVNKLNKEVMAVMLDRIKELE
jgi:hypothetical protein